MKSMKIFFLKNQLFRQTRIVVGKTEKISKFFCELFHKIKFSTSLYTKNRKFVYRLLKYFEAYFLFYILVIIIFQTSLFVCLFLNQSISLVSSFYFRTPFLFSEHRNVTPDPKSFSWLLVFIFNLLRIYSPTIK